jgi:two-component system response regulator YesN
MPVMGGLDLMKKAREASMNIQFAILSGYADFTYAQKAINYGAIGYCVKPIEEEEVVTLLKKTHGILSSAGRAQDANILEMLDEGSVQSKAGILEAVNKAGLGWDGGGMLIAVSIGAEEPGFLKDIRHMAITYGTRKKARLMNYGSRDAVVAAAEAGLPAGMRGLGLSGRFADVDEIRPAIDKAETAAFHFFIKGGPGVFDAADFYTADASEAVKKLETAMASRDVSAVQGMLSVISNSFAEGNYSMSQALMIYNMISYFICKAAAENQEQYLNTCEQLASMFVSAAEMIDALAAQVLCSMKSSGENYPEEKANTAFKALLQHVNDKFYMEMSLQSLSKVFYINPGHITRLFKKEVGETFVEYLTKTRVKHACEILKNTAILVYEVGERVGYSDYFYFCRIFKKATGKTPTQYRDESQKQ